LWHYLLALSQQGHLLQQLALLLLQPMPQQYVVPKEIQGVVPTLRKKEVVMNAIQGLVQEGHVSQRHRVLGECAKNRNQPFFFFIWLTAQNVNLTTGFDL
jgi:hypothetical protein